RAARSSGYTRRSARARARFHRLDSEGRLQATWTPFRRALILRAWRPGRVWHLARVCGAGCRGFFGPVPSASLDASGTRCPLSRAVSYRAAVRSRDPRRSPVSPGERATQLSSSPAGSPGSEHGGAVRLEPRGDLDLAIAGVFWVEGGRPARRPLESRRLRRRGRTDLEAGRLC